MKAILLFLFILFFLSNKFAYSTEFQNLKSTEILDNKGIICLPIRKESIDNAKVFSYALMSESIYPNFGDAYLYVFRINDNGNTEIETKALLYQTNDKEIIFYHPNLVWEEGIVYHKISRVTLQRTDGYGSKQNCEVIDVLRDDEVYEKTEEIHKQLKIKSDKSKKI